MKIDEVFKCINIILSLNITRINIVNIKYWWVLYKSCIISLIMFDIERFEIECLALMNLRTVFNIMVY